MLWLRERPWQEAPNLPIETVSTSVVAEIPSSWTCLSFLKVLQPAILLETQSILTTALMLDKEIAGSASLASDVKVQIWTSTPNKLRRRTKPPQVKMKKKIRTIVRHRRSCSRKWKQSSKRRKSLLNKRFRSSTLPSHQQTRAVVSAPKSSALHLLPLITNMHILKSRRENKWWRKIFRLSSWKTGSAHCKTSNWRECKMVLLALLKTNKRSSSFYLLSLNYTVTSS